MDNHTALLTLIKLRDYYKEKIEANALHGYDPDIVKNLITCEKQIEFIGNLILTSFDYE